MLASPSATADDARWHASAIEQVDRAVAGGPAVAVLCWPADAELAAQLAAQQIPRLLLVDAPVDDVDIDDDLLDWVSLPATDDDVRARIRRLRRIASDHPAKPVLDGSGRLIYGGGWVELAPVEERLAIPLVERFGRVVPERDLIHAGWPDGPPATGTLRPRLSRLRRRVGDIELDLVAVRGQGYCLQRREAAALTDITS